ncbi:MAG TPA: protein-L-isoaspartate(D-aspartate) O-methyltransferase [Anaerolineae bacterium]|nr:protein-L-isoaspartate(D-aspartate) O-methyltransferase [Anaerolineae bacterium]HNU05213.1 protein-L-isoaspartate(D-aspartate) O-methyltransferase [Anaerolineae bacterium]
MSGNFSRSSAPKEMTFADQREWMVRHQLEAWGIADGRVLDAMRRVPRELFVPGEQQEDAYYDGALPIAEGQTISQPYVVATMTEALRLGGREKVLEIGTGSGYQTAVLSLLAAQVFTVERIALLARQAQETLARFGADNVRFRVGDGSLGWPEHAPYDAILVTCAAPAVPQPLVQQLADGGRLIVPVGPRGYQDLVRVRRHGAATTEERLSPVAFVPLIGEHGW